MKVLPRHPGVGPWGKVRPPAARPVDHRLRARSLWSRLQPASASRLHSQGRCGVRLDNRATRKRSPPGRAETGPLDRLLRPRKGWLGTRQAAREKPQRRGRGPGSRRRPAPASRSLERGPLGGRARATAMADRCKGCGISSLIQTIIGRLSRLRGPYIAVTLRSGVGAPQEL